MGLREAKEQYLGQTTSLCEACLSLVETRIVLRGLDVFYVKHCKAHGLTETRVSTDSRYFVEARSSATPRFAFGPEDAPLAIEHGCPFDCGPCSGHEQACLAGIIEVLDECDLTCPTCIAGSKPGLGNTRSLARIQHTIRRLEATGATTVMISGGEPTLHPDIYAILELAVDSKIPHVFLITNGRRIATETAFSKRLARLGPKLEVYLQFDSLDDASLVDIRGERLSGERRAALENLEQHQVATTLVCVVKRGVNDREVVSLASLAQQYRCTRGVSFQPVRALGRTEGFQKGTHDTTLTEVRTALVEGRIVTDEDFVPHPANPANIAVAYLQRSPSGPLRPITRQLHADLPELSHSFFFRPDMSCDEYEYSSIFRLAIVSYLDRFNFCVSSARRSFIFFATDDGRLVPVDTYYAFHAKYAHSQQTSR